MTAQDALVLRVLPIRVPIIDGESLHSWIEAVAARYQMSVRELLPALGLRRPRTPYSLIEGVSGQTLRSLEQQAGFPVGRLDGAVLDRYSALGLAGFPGRRSQGDWQTLWTRASGSGFCPRCLAENGGRWPLSWYLNWTFACTRHNVLMAARCAACGRRPRSGENRFDHVIDGRACCHYSQQALGRSQPGPGMPRCGTPLTAQPVEELDAAHPLIACQRWIDRVLTMPDLVAAAGLRVPPGEALAAVAALMRYAVAADGSLGDRRVEHLASGSAAGNISLPPALPAGPPTVAYGMVADDPVLFGVVAAVAVDVLAAPSLTAAARTASWLRAGVGRREGLRGSRWPSSLDMGATGSPLLNAVALRQRAPWMNAASRLSYRTENAVPRRPDAAAAAAGEWPYGRGRMASVPARLVPQVAWKSVADVLARHEARDTGVLRAALSMAMVRCGTQAEWADIAAWLVLPPGFGTIGRVWKRLDSEGRLDQILTSIDALVEELTEHPPPIDYARRRWIFRDLRFVTPSRLRRALHGVGRVLTEVRLRYATMLLWETLTGGDIRFADRALAPLNWGDRTNYAQFRSVCGEALRDYMAVEGERLLLSNRIDEPVTWQPALIDSVGPEWRSPPADLTRILPGWDTPSRRGQLRHSAHDHTRGILGSRLRTAEGGSD